MTTNTASLPLARPSRLTTRLAVAMGSLALVVGASPAVSAQSSLDMPALSAPVAPAPAPQIPIGDISRPVPAPAPAPTTEAARVAAEIHTHSNRARAAAGLRPLARSAALDGIAQRWSERMAAEDRMYHNPQVGAQIQATYGARWSRHGENVLQNWRGASGEALVQQWMNSPAHRANLLTPGFTELGVGVAVARSGKLYATQNLVALR